MGNFGWFGSFASCLPFHQLVVMVEVTELAWRYVPVGEGLSHHCWRWVQFGEYRFARHFEGDGSVMEEEYYYRRAQVAKVELVVYMLGILM